MKRLTLQALGLMIIIPTLVVIYVFQDRLKDSEPTLLLLLALALSGLGFYLLWLIVRGVSRIQQGLRDLASGKTSSLTLENGPGQLHEMAEIINALNKLTVEFRENTAQLEAFIQRFATLAELTEITARVPDISELLVLVIRKVMSPTHARRGSIVLVREDGSGADIVAAEGWDPADYDPPRRDSFAVQVIQSGNPLLVEDIEKAFVGRTNDRTRYVSSSFLIMPLKTKNSTVGAVCLSEKATGGPFNSHDQQFLTVLLGQVGFAIENARLLKQAREAAGQLRETVQDQELQIRDAQRQIVKSETLSALGQMAGGVAHDFNNLIQAILGHSEFAQEGLPPEDSRFRSLDQIRAAAERAAGLTRQLLAFGRRQMLQPVELDLNSATQELIRILGRVIGEHIRVELDEEEGLGMVSADPRQFEQLLLNLCINARDAMPEGGTLRLRTRNLVIGEERSREHPVVEPGSYVLLQVCDTGCGMDTQTLEQVFEPFFTTKRVGEGTGLGLSTVYGIVRQHGGTIDVTSEVNQGTTFSIYLPMVDRPAATSEEATATEDAPKGGGETILVAEDEETVREIAACILNRFGYTVLEARDGLEAVAVFEANADKIDLAILDAVMPGLIGREVYHRIRAIKPDVRVLISSGYSADAVHTGFIQEEDLEFLQKPYRLTTLVKTVRDILDSPQGRKPFATAIRSKKTPELEPAPVA